MKLNTAVMIVSLAMAFSPLHADAQTGGIAGGVEGAYGPDFEAAAATAKGPEPLSYAGASDARARVVYWNEVALQANAIDHTPVAAGEIRVMGEQVGPARSSRALAIVQLAVYDSINAIAGRYPSYSGLPRAASDSSPDAAIAQAAHDTLAALYPSQKSRLDHLLGDDMARIPPGRAKYNGTDLGRRAASTILALRANDGSQFEEPLVGVNYAVSNAPGKWRPDPVSRNPRAIGAYWGRVRPFVIPSAADFDLPPPPALTSAEYAAAFDEVKQLGGDGIHTSTRRTPDQTIIGIFWAYDGTPRIGTPPRLFNQIALKISAQRTSDALQLARLLALTNVAMADSAIVAWKIKYEDSNWRPVTGIREASPGSSPTGLGDGNPATRGDPGWTPLGAPASNLIGPNFTPPFPAYPSGHSSFGATMFQILRRFYGTDTIAFSFVSDEYNGITRDNLGRVRPRLTRSFSKLSQAEEECGQSRIYLGVHWQYDRVGGATVGKRVADYVFGHGLVRAAN